MAQDYYNILGVDKNASADEIKAAYRKLAKQHHPDKFSTASEEEKKKNEEAFKKINQAYSVLSDPQKKENYDRFGTEDPQAGGFNWGGGAGFGFSDIFSSIFDNFTGGMGSGGSGFSMRNAPMEGEDVIHTIKLSFKEAAFGCEKDISYRVNQKCSTCNGSGAKDSKSIHTCSKCNGTGMVTTIKRTFLGQMQSTQPCPDCNGKGKIIKEKCSACAGRGQTNNLKTEKIKIPAGINNENQMTFRGKGHAGKNGGPNGNLIILFNIESHSLFTRKGYDIHLEVPITIIQATLGDKIDIPTLSSPIKQTIPAGTQSGTIFRIKGSGIKYLNSSRHGDLYVKIIVEVPKNLSFMQKKKLKDMNDVIQDKQYEKIQKFNENVKKSV